MSNSVDNRVVQMEFDNKQFEKGVKKTLGSLDKLKAALKLEDTSKGLKDLQKTADKFNIDSVGEAADKAGTHFTAMQVVAFTALQRITNAAIDAGKKIFSALTVDMPKSGFSKYEEKINAVQTIMFATGKTINEVDKVLSRLMTYSDETSYSFTEMANSIGKFTSAGIDLDRAERAMEGIANWAASAGVSTTNASSAFYNLSQAMSTGAMKMQDWKSIQNLNMSTVQFKQTCIETAQEMIKMNRLTGKASSAFRRAKVDVNNFDSTLSSGWLTKEVLLEVLEKYADTTTEFGLAAFHAAQEAKTFTDAIEAVKDALGSGWMKTWEYIFGNKDRATKLWTGLTNGVLEFTDRITSARNDVLKFWAEAGGENSRRGKKSGIGKTGYEALFGGLANILTNLKNLANEVIDVFAKIFAPKSLGFLEKLSLAEQDPAYKGAKNATKYLKILKGNGHYNKLGDILLDLSHRFEAWTEKIMASEETLEKFGKIVGGVASILKIPLIIIKSFIKFIKLFTGSLDELSGKGLDTLADIGEWIENAVKWLEESDFVFKTLKSIYDWCADKVSKVAGWLTTIKEKFEELTGIDLKTKMFESFADAMEKIGNVLKTVGGAIYIAAKAVWDYTKPFRDKIWTALSPIFQKIGEKLTKFAQKFSAVVTKVWNWISGIKEGSITIEDIKKKIDELIQTVKDWWNALKSGDENNILVRAFNAIKDAAQNMKEKLEPIIDWLGEKLGGITPGKALFGGLGVGLIVFLIGLGKLLNKSGGLLQALKDIGESISGFFTSLKKSIKYKVIAQAALAIAVMAGALALLTLVDQKKLRQAAWSLAIVVGIMTIAVVALGVLQSINVDKFSGSISGIGLIMLELAWTVTLIAVALSVVSSIKDPWTGFWPLLAVIGVMTAVSIALAYFTNGKSITKGAWFMIAFAFAITKMIDALVKMAEYDLASLGKQLLPLTGIIGIVAIIAVAASEIKFGSAVALLILVGSLYALFYTLKQIQEFNLDAGSLINKILIIAIVAKALTDCAKSLGKNYIANLNGMASFVGMVIGLIGIVLALKLLDTISLSWALVGKLTIVIGAIALLMVINKYLGQNHGFNTAPKTMAGMGLAVLALAVALKILEKINPQQALMSAMALSMVMVMFGVMAFIAGKVEGELKAFEGFAIVIATLAVAIGLLSLLPWKDVLISAAALSGAMVLIGIAMKLASGFKGDLASMIVFAVTIGLVAAALFFLAQYDWQNLLAAGAALAATILMVGVAAKLAGGGSAAGALNLLVLSLAIIAISFALYTLASVVTGGALIDSVIAMALALFTLGAAAAIFGSTATIFLLGAAVIAALGGACMVLGIGLEFLFAGLEAFRDQCAPIIEKVKDIFSPLQPLFDSIGTAIKDFFDVIGSVGSKIVDFFSGLFGFGDKAKAFKDDVVDTFDAAGDAAEKNAGRIENAENTIESATVTPVASESAGGGASTAQTRRMAPARQNKAVAEAGTETGEAVGNAVVDAEVETIEARSDDVGNAVTNSFLGNDMLEKLPPEVQKQLQNAMGGSGGFSLGNIGSFIGGTDGNIDASSLLGFDLNAFMGQGTEGGGAFGNAFVDGASTIIGGDGIPESLRTMAEANAPMFSESGTKYADATMTAFNEGVAGKGKEAAQAIVGELESQEVINQYIGAGDIHADSYGDGIYNQDTADDIVLAALDLSKEGSDTMSSPSSVHGWTVGGQNAAQGLIDGLTSMKQSVAKRAADLALTAYNAARKALEINSPSKKFTFLGEGGGEGLGIGFLNMIPYVTKSSEQMANASIDPIKNSIAQISDYLSNDMDTTPVIRPVLDLTDINAGMNAMGGYFGNRTIGLSSLGAARRANVTGATKAQGAMDGIQNGSGRKVEINITTQQLDKSTVDYLIRRANKVLGGAV